MQLPTKTAAEVIADIQTKLNQKPRRQGTAYALIVGAGFSYPLVPLTRELLHERIGDFYYPRDKTMEGSIERSLDQRRKLSRRYWKDFNEAASLAGEPLVALGHDDLPMNPTEAYQSLFTYHTANALFSPEPDPLAGGWLARTKQRRGIPEPEPKPRALAGEKFVRDFLQDVLDPGGYESRGESLGDGPDYCTTGRNRLNAAHFFLASLIELQQTGVLWKLRPFCRTIFTTNFDTLLQEALQLVNVLYSLTDRPERGLDPGDFPPDDRIVHLVYTHGTILRHNGASTRVQLGDLSGKNADILKAYLERRDVLVLGYGGWDDSLMSALQACDAQKHRVYWCNVYPAEGALEALPLPVLELLTKTSGNGFYVPLEPDGAGGFMARLYQSLAPDHGLPSLLRDPITPEVNRLRRLTLEPLTLSAPDSLQASAGELPPPQLAASILRIHGTACHVLDAARFCFIPSSTDRYDTGWTFIQAEAQASAIVEEGFALVLAGEVDKALEVWTRVLALPGVPVETAQAASYIGIVHHRAGRLDLAIAAYTRAVDLGFASPSLQVEAATNRGAAHHQQGKFDLAMEDFSRAISIWENHPPAVPTGFVVRALIYRGLTRERNGDAGGACEDFRGAVKLKDVPPECGDLLARSPGWLKAST